MRTPNWLDDPVHRAAVSVAASTVLLTLAMVGILSFSNGGNAGVGGRLPAYVFAAALAFVVTLFVLDDPAADGVQIIVAVAGISLGVFGLVALAGEGVVYAVEHPGDVFVPQLLLYIAAAGLVCTGVGVWGLRHWREFTTGATGQEDVE
ncbi:hypothetical protein [Haloarchaeobius litoreus]|uniref:Uncharacterized protein n=1 Tax=Haloarchaeobius litoreus TaxID=755306 RepID=A0ABD6DKT6_9EURY|nr:hypothetical protein [Haloarchaeobius litoreus]